MPEIIVKLGERIIHRYFFDKDVLNVGRARDNDIVIENLSVSRNHARVKRENGKYFLTDMNSANGTLVNGVRVTKTELFHNDQVAVGKHILLFLDSEESAPAAPPAAAKPASGAVTAQDSAESPAIIGIIGVLVVTKGKQAGQEFRVYKTETYIGRASENDVRIHDWFVSKKHALIRREGDTFHLKDLDSWRGTTVNGNSVREVRLQEGDEIIFGTTVLQFKLADAEAYAAAHPVQADGSDSRFDNEESWASDSSAYRRLEIQRPSAEVRLPSKDEIARPATQDVEPDEASVPLDEASAPADFTDEFAPMTTEELEALENEDGLELDRADLDEDRRLSWEELEADQMFAMHEEPEEFSLGESHESLTAEEEAAVDLQKAVEGLQQRDRPRAQTDIAVEEREESIALEGVSEPAPAANNDGTAAKKAKPAKAEPAQEAPAQPAAAEPAPAAEKAAPAEIRMWEKALQNKSAVIRRNAAKELKKLTGKDYDWESGPTGS